MAENAEETELLIEDYLDGRMDPAQRVEFEGRMERDPELRDRVNSTTRATELAQQALGWVTPGEDFEEKVNSKIISITQSGQGLQPPVQSSSRNLTSQDPEAKLLADPDAAREKRRLLVLALIAALLFLLAAGTIAYSIRQGMDNSTPTHSGGKP